MIVLHEPLILLAIIFVPENMKYNTRNKSFFCGEEKLLLYFKCATLQKVSHSLLEYHGESKFLNFLSGTQNMTAIQLQSYQFYHETKQ